MIVTTMKKDAYIRIFDENILDSRRHFSCPTLNHLYAPPTRRRRG